MSSEEAARYASGRRGSYYGAVTATEVPVPSAAVLRHVEVPPGPGTLVTIRLPAGNDMLKPVPLPGQGFTLDFGGDVWRSELRSASGTARA